MTDNDTPAPDPGNTEDPRELTADLDPDDDVHERIALVNREQGSHLQDPGHNDERNRN